MEIQTQIQVHQAIEYMKRDPEFPFDTHDDIRDILSYYDVEIDLDKATEKLLKKEIAKLTSQRQTSEVVKVVTDDRAAALLMDMW